jgi:hypothetical protein
MQRLILSLFCGYVVVSVSGNWATARPQYMTEFKDKYGKVDADYGKTIDTAKCAVCHDPKDLKDKKKRNDYGKFLAKKLKNEKDKDKIKKSLDTAYDEKAPGKDETFGDRIKAKKLPAE